MDVQDCRTFLGLAVASLLPVDSQHKHPEHKQPRHGLPRNWRDTP